MDHPHETTASLPDKPSFFGRPESFHWWGRLGPKYLGGLLAGIGLGLFVASWLMDLGVMNTAWTGFAAIVLIGGGQGFALQAARREWRAERGRA
jgi:hypothetical protein